MKKELKNKIEALGLPVNGNKIIIDGTAYPLPLVKGNKKIGGGVWHASTLPTNQIITAYTAAGVELQERGTCPCTCNGCYGTRGNYRFNSVKMALLMRTRLLRRYPEIYFQLVSAQIESENIQNLRVHATGDFIENEARGWFETFKKYPDLIGWTYTKCQIAGDIALLDSLSNFNIVDSIVKGCGYNFGHIDYILAVWEKLKAENKNVYICRCGVDKNQHCETCRGCSLNKHVLFIEHSTDYNAAADPLYSTISELINAQPSQAR